MTAYLAVVKYPLAATAGERIRALKDGLGECAMGLADLGLTFEEIEAATEEALEQARDELEAIRR